MHAQHLLMRVPHNGRSECPYLSTRTPRRKQHKRHRKAQREYLLRMDGHRCFLCDREMTTAGSTEETAITVDHEATERGGSNHIDNMILACKACNEQRANAYPTESLLEKLEKALEARRKCPFQPNSDDPPVQENPAEKAGLMRSGGQYLSKQMRKKWQKEIAAQAEGVGRKRMQKERETPRKAPPNRPGPSDPVVGGAEADDPFNLMSIEDALPNIFGGGSGDAT